MWYDRHTMVLAALLLAAATLADLEVALQPAPGRLTVQMAVGSTLSSTVTVAVLLADSETVKTMLAVEAEPPSLTAEAFAMLTVGMESSLLIVPVPNPVPVIVAFVGFDSKTVKVSFDSRVESPFVTTTTCCVVWPAT